MSLSGNHFYNRVILPRMGMDSQNPQNPALHEKFCYTNKVFALESMPYETIL
jgi:hypothetical protein